MDDPILSPDPAVRKEAIRNMLAQLTVPNADPYDTHFEPDSPECREKDAKKEQNEAQAACKELSADIRIAPGSDRIELFLQEGEESAEYSSEEEGIVEGGREPCSFLPSSM